MGPGVFTGRAWGAVLVVATLVALAVLVVAPALLGRTPATSSSRPPAAAPTTTSAAPAPTRTAASPAPAAAGPTALSVVALGDSVPAGTGCSCSPFPELYGDLLAARTGDRVTVHDHGTNGQVTAGLLTELGGGPVALQVARAEVVLVTIGANDLGAEHSAVTAGTCVTADRDCARDQLAAMRSGVSSVLARVAALRDGRPTTVLVTGYWNVFEDGDVARRAYGATGVAASVQLTRRADTAIRAATIAAGATYVDLFGPFQQRGTGITALLADDGDHPSAAGHRLIAGLLLGAGLPVEHVGGS